MCAAAAPVTLPTNLPGATTIAPPPAGFDPLAASAADLETYGFPARPSSANRRAVALWSRAMRAAKLRLMPLLRATDHAAGAALHTRIPGLPGIATSKNWSAMLLANNVTSLGAGSFTQAAASFNIPIAQQAFGACTGGGDHLYAWAGIDGWYNNEVFQAGTESSAYCAGGVTSTVYSAWYEWYPQLAVDITNLPVRPGDVMTVFVTATSSTTGRALVLNATTNQYVVIGFSAPPGVHLVGNSAEWVEERPYWNGVLSTLTNYVTAWMSGTGASIGNAWYDWGSPPPVNLALQVNMLDNNGGVISIPTGLFPNAIVFNDTGSAR